MDPELENMAEMAGGAAMEAYESILAGGGSPADAMSAATEAAGTVMTDMGADPGMVDTMVNAASESFTEAMDANPGMDPMEAFDAAGAGVDDAMTEAYGPPDGPPTGMDEPTTMEGVEPPPGMEGDMPPPPPGMEGDMSPPPGMEGDMPPPPPGMEGDMSPPPGMEGDMPPVDFAMSTETAPPGMESDMPPPEGMEGMDAAESYMEDASAASGADSFDPSAMPDPTTMPEGAEGVEIDPASPPPGPGPTDSDDIV